MPDLLNVDVAIERILTTITPLSTEVIPLPQSLGRVLYKDIISDINLPPFPNSAMDGYAMKADDSIHASKDSPVTLQVTMDIPAGVAPIRAINHGESARIMTGAPIPEGADAIIPVENTDTLWIKGEQPPLPKQVNIFRRVQSGDYVRPVGENIHKGQLVLTSGTIIRPQEIGMLAALGRPEISVWKRPRIVILSTGDELVDIDEALAPGKIRDSNGYMLHALSEANGCEAIRLPIARDTIEDVQNLFQRAIELQPDIIISSAGVSVGTGDLVQTVIEQAGDIDFWRINLRPGKPLAFGNVQGIPFFGLPGNPVSALVTFVVIVLPALYKLTGRTYSPITIMAQLGENLQSDGRRSYIRVQLQRNDNGYTATSTGTQSSGALMSTILADGLLIVPEGVKTVDKGTICTVQLMRDPSEIK